MERRLIYGDGFYAEEFDGLRTFRWMDGRAKLSFNSLNEGEWFVFEVGYTGIMPVSIRLSGGVEPKEFVVVSGWQVLAYELGNEADCRAGVELSVDYEFYADGDSRKLSVMIGSGRVELPSAYTLNSSRLHEEMFREVRVASKPTFLTYETSASCNLKCSMCVVSEELGKFEDGRADSTEDGWRMYHELLPYASKVQLHATGEVFFRDHVWPALKSAEPYATARSLEVEVFTNGLLLDDGIIEKIMASPLTDIVISFDAATRRTYKRLRGGNWERLLGNVRRLVESNAGKKRLAMAMVLMRENIEELPQFVRLARDLGVRTVIFWPLLAIGMTMPKRVVGDFVFSYPQQMLINYPKITSVMIGKAVEQARELGIGIGITPCFSKDYTAIESDDLPYPLDVGKFEALQPGRSMRHQESCTGVGGCYFPWNSAFITADGRFAPCLLMLYRGGVGNVFEGGFEEAWNNEVMQELRASIIKGVPHRLCEDAQCVFVNNLY